jgi:hypothetical protein
LIPFTGKKYDFITFLYTAFTICGRKNCGQRYVAVSLFWTYAYTIMISKVKNTLPCGNLSEYPTNNWHTLFSSLNNLATELT